MAQPYGYPYRQAGQPARQPVVRGQSPAVKPVPKLPTRAAQPKPTVRPAPTPQPKPERIVMPSPEHFGIELASAPAPEEDWLPLLRQLDQMGMSRFEFVKQGDGFRLACDVNGRRIETIGATKAEVLRQALTDASATR